MNLKFYRNFSFWKYFLNLYRLPTWINHVTRGHNKNIVELTKRAQTYLAKCSTSLSSRISSGKFPTQRCLVSRTMLAVGHSPSYFHKKWSKKLIFRSETLVPKQDSWLYYTVCMVCQWDKYSSEVGIQSLNWSLMTSLVVLTYK